MQASVGVNVGKLAAPKNGFRPEQVNIIGEPEGARARN